MSRARWLAGLLHEALEAAGLPELSGAGIGGIDRHLRREQDGIGAGIGDLLRHQLPVAHVALQGRAIAVEEQHDHARLAHVEMLGDVNQHAAVAVGLVLPVDAPRIAAMAAAVALGDVEEGRVGSGVVAEIGEGRRFHADQRRQVVTCRTLIGDLRCERGDLVRRLLRLLLHGALGREVRRLPLQKTLARGREAFFELRGREAILERVAACDLLRIGFGDHLDVGLRVRCECRRVRRLAALNQRQRQRHQG